MHPRPTCVILLLITLGLPARAEELDCVTTEWKLLGANHRVCVFSFEDPDVKGVTCYLSQAKTGGIKGSVGVAEDPSEFSLHCVRTGPLSIPGDVFKPKKVFSEGTSIIFKDTGVTRFHDPKRNALVYLAVSRKIIAGSPANAVSVVPLNP